MGRRDQVALKLYAALDRQKGRRHLQDLGAIGPTSAEMEFAVCWLLDRKTSLEFRNAVRKISEVLGFRELAAFIRLKSERAKITKPRRSSPPRRKPGK